MSMTLSPAALVCTMRTVAARTVATARRHIRATESLVRMEEHSKLSRHVADPLFPPRPADRRPGARVHAGFRDVQDQGSAAAPREAAGSCALLRLPFDRDGVSSAAAARGTQRLHRRRNP